MSQDLVARALTALRARDFSQARNDIQAFAATNQLELQHYLIWGLCDLSLTDWASAEETFLEATRYFPHQPQLWFNLGVAQENLGQTDNAIDSFEHSLDLKPDQADAYGNLSNLFRKNGEFQEAVAMAHRAFELGAPKAQAMNALGLGLARQGLMEGAEKAFRQALAYEPDDASALTNLANCAVDRLDFEAAWPLFKAAEALSGDPAIRHEEGMARLLSGDVQQGWLLYEARLERPAFIKGRPDLPIWSGQSLFGKKLLVMAEQGFGDTIQFCRYASLLEKEGAKLGWLIQAPLRRLIAENLPGQVVTEPDQKDWDFWIPLLSLPLHLSRLSFNEAPPAPYLKATASRKLVSDEQPGLKIGLVWTGSPTHERAAERSVDLHEFSPLWKELNGRFVAPFKGFGLDDISVETPVIRVDHLLNDFQDTADLLMELDVLITVDTAVAHLAGALGVKTFLLLSVCPDWRWGTASNTTPWYPSFTLLRQQTRGDWGAVIESLLAGVRGIEAK